MAVDTEAIEAVKRGEKDRYAELVVRYQRMVYGIAWSQLGDNDLCEEAAQETFVRAFRYLVALRHPERFGGWLARIARNVSTSLLRKHMRELKGRERWRLESPQPHELQQPTNEEQSLGGTLRQILTELPHTHRECLILFYLEGKNIRETAEVLDISEAAVKTRLHRARTDLRGRLEDRLEDSLAHLAPRRDLSLVILPLLPAVPFAAGLGASTVAAKVVAGFGQVAAVGFLLVTSLFQAVFVGAILGWYSKIETDNLAPGAGKQFRSRMIKRTFLTLFFMMVGITFLSQWAALRFGPSLVFQLLVPFCLWGFWRTSRMLRVNNSHFVWGQLLAVGTFGVASFFIGFYDAPFWIFLAALLPLNIVLYKTNKTKPARHDYNLFVRSTMGLLGKPDTQPHAIQRCTPLQRKAFAQFLGRRFLITDFALDSHGVRLWLPPVAPGASIYLSVSGSNSAVTIDESAACSAQLGDRDQRNLAKFCNTTPASKAELERSVAQVVQSAFQHFLTGDAAAAEVLLDTASDEHVFVSPVAQSRAYRTIGIITIVASIIALVMFGMLSSSFHPPKPVSQSTAAQSMLAWSASTPPAGDFHYVMYASAQPTPAFFGTLDTAAYRNALFAYLQSRIRGNSMEIFLKNSDSVSPLYHALRDRTLTPEQFDALGFTHEKALAALDQMNKNDFARIDKQGGMNSTTSTESYGSANLELMAMRLASLDMLGCLDHIDTQALPAQLAAHQVTPNWSVPEGYAPIDTAKAAGLFDFGWCDLRTTRAALWILQTLDTLDAILQFHKGNGKFQGNFRSDPWIAIHGNEDDTFYALDPSTSSAHSTASATSTAGATPQAACRSSSPPSSRTRTGSARTDSRSTSPSAACPPTA